MVRLVCLSKRGAVLWNVDCAYSYLSTTCREKKVKSELERLGIQLVGEVIT